LRGLLFSIVRGWRDYDVFFTTLVPARTELIEAHNATHAFRGVEVTPGSGFTAFSSRILVPS
jgi:hypothetical protein